MSTNLFTYGLYQGHEGKAEIIIKDGKIVEIRFTSVSRMPPLTGSKLRDFKKLVNSRAEEIVQKWIDFFVRKKSIELEKITKRLK